MEDSTEDETRQASLRGVAGIYRITLVLDGRSYVGQSVDIYTRWGTHRYQLRHGEHHSAYLQRVWNKYGEDAFEYVLLEVCETEGLDTDAARDLLTDREQWWMDNSDSTFNVVSVAGLGGKLGTTTSDETRAKMSAARKGVPKSPEWHAAIRASLEARTPGRHAEIVEAAAAGNRGVKRSAEARANISEGCKGRVISPETRAKMSASHKARHARLQAEKEATTVAKENDQVGRQPVLGD